MIAESLAIVIIIAVMAVMYLRSRKPLMAALALPLTAPSVMHLISMALWGYPQIDGGQHLYLRVGFVTVGAAISTLVCLRSSKRIASRRGRISYLVLCLFFVVAISIAYIIYLV